VVVVVQRPKVLEEKEGPELEESYRRQIKQVKAELLTLRQKPRPAPVTLVDLNPRYVIFWKTLKMSGRSSLKDYVIACSS